MNHDEFISRVRTEIAKSYGLKTDAEIDAFFIGIEEGVKDKQEALEKRDKMLRDTVAELCEAKRLLKDFVSEYDGCKTFTNRDEVLKLIGEDEDENS